MQFSADRLLIIPSGMHAILLSGVERSLEGLLHHTIRELGGGTCFVGILAQLALFQET